MFAIHSMGLGATLNGIVPAAINKVDELRKVFNIPDNHEAVISIMCGYPKYKYNKIKIPVIVYTACFCIFLLHQHTL